MANEIPYITHINTVTHALALHRALRRMAGLVFSFWFSGRWRALAKGTACAVFFKPRNYSFSYSGARPFLFPGGMASWSPRRPRATRSAWPEQGERSTSTHQKAHSRKKSFYSTLFMEESRREQEEEAHIYMCVCVSGGAATARQAPETQSATPRSPPPGGAAAIAASSSTLPPRSSASSTTPSSLWR